MPESSDHDRLFDEASVVAVVGLPGTGKTRLGTALHPRLPREFSFVDLDTMTQPLVRAALAVSGHVPIAASANGTLRRLRDAQYACLLDHVRQIVRLGRSVMFVAPMTHELEQPETFLRMVDDLGAPRFLLIRMTASPEIVHARLSERGDLLDEVRLARWSIDRHRYDAPVPLPMPGLELDSTSTPADRLVELAWKWLRSQLEPSARLADDRARGRFESTTSSRRAARN